MISDALAECREEIRRLAHLYEPGDQPAIEVVEQLLAALQAGFDCPPFAPMDQAVEALLREIAAVDLSRVKAAQDTLLATAQSYWKKEGAK